MKLLLIALVLTLGFSVCSANNVTYVGQLPSCLQSCSSKSAPIDPIKCVCGDGCQGEFQRCNCTDLKLNHKTSAMLDAIWERTEKQSVTVGCYDFCGRECGIDYYCQVGCMCRGACSGPRQRCVCNYGGCKKPTI